MFARIRPLSTRESWVRHYTKQVPRGVRKEPYISPRIAGAVFLLAPVSTFCLGVWQYRRRQWKINMIKELDEKVRKADPVELNLENCSGVEYQRVRAQGSFDNSVEILIGPRTFIDSSGGSAGGGVISFSRAGDSEKVGYLVISPFTLTDGSRVLVNRGWVPTSRAEVTARMSGQVVGETNISGVLRLTEETSSLMPNNKEDTFRWHSRDVAALASKLNTQPVFLDLDLESSRDVAQRGGPVGGQTRIALRNDHVQYMLTWWGLTLVTTILWIQKFVLK